MTNQVHSLYPRFEVNVPSQGLTAVRMTPEELLEWVTGEQEFVRLLQDKVVNNDLRFAGQGYGASSVTSMGSNELSGIVASLNEKRLEEVVPLLDRYLARARENRRILASGRLGRAIKRMIQDGRGADAHLLTLLFSEDFENQQQQRLGLKPLREALLVNPVFLAGIDLEQTEQYNKSSSAKLDQIRSEMEKIETAIILQRKRMSDLEELYHKKLMIEAPASHWQEVARSKTVQWRIWLAIFVVAIIAPLVVAVCYRNDVLGFVAEATRNTNGEAILGIAIVTIPALAYGWVLRQISRLYGRAFDLAVDASHRKSLATTFLGLSENPNTKLGDAERALILEALYRPQPPYLSDDGPPNAVLDALKGRL